MEIIHLSSLQEGFALLSVIHFRKDTEQYGNIVFVRERNLTETLSESALQDDKKSQVSTSSVRQNQGSRERNISGEKYKETHTGGNANRCQEG